MALKPLIPGLDYNSRVEPAQQHEEQDNAK